ncbi:patatin-like phospholipase family protein [Paraburkholderia sp.]|uniref:patatin-like phospholipase family protein n=1 Tax=Paraburkholderia sp. TaxID=1926495 RepID=UPI002D4BECAF|nr:patatin-like phospholipase family protein [Paraburkholderia sp.]HZZ06280.1 patatin-like phospholipase family protein [Paraburkholderia sp.]
MSRASASEQLQQTAGHTWHRPLVLRLRCTVVLLACGIAAFTRPALAAESACGAEAVPAGRPSVGLVLSGGGARGYAHLGVLKVLEENRIPVDCIAATSMGAVVGGLYASGMTAQDMQKRLTGINLADIAFDVTERADLPQSRREDERLYVNSLSLGYGANGFRLPVGLVQGNRLQALLQDWTSAVPGSVSFDRLPIPYRAIATDLRTGQKVVLDHGSLPQAIRASMALPGLFAPADIDGRTLVDGGIVSNLPIETARDMGANVVIAVDIGSPLRPLDALASPADVMQQMIGILIHQNVARQREQLQTGDVLIEPALGSLSFTDFANASQAIAAGAAATRAALPQLQHLALSPADYAAWRARHAAPAAHPVRITQIEITSQGVVPEARIRAALHVKPGDAYDPAALNKDLLALSTAGDFDSVSQQLVDDGDEHKLVIVAQQKQWGPNFLLFGLGLSSSSTDEGGFRLHLGYRRPWLTSSGLEGRVDGTVGSDLINLHAELRQPLSSSFGYYVAPYLEFQRRYANLYDDSGDVKVTQYRLQTERVGVDFGLPLARLGDFRIGVAYAHGFASPQYNLPLEDGPNSPLLFPDIYGRQLSARARLVIDQLDDPLFARKGYFGELRVERSLFAGSDSFTEVYGKSIVAASYGRHSINASIEAGNDFGGTNLTNPFGFTLGGFQHLSAYAADQLSGNSMVYGQVTYMNQLATFNASPIRGLYAGLSIEAGNVWNRDSQFGSGPLKRSVTAFTALTSSFGPIYLGVAFAPGGRHNFYFQLGHTY